MLNFASSSEGFIFLGESSGNHIEKFKRKFSINSSKFSINSRKFSALVVLALLERLSSVVLCSLYPPSHSHIYGHPKQTMCRRAEHNWTVFLWQWTVVIETQSSHLEKMTKNQALHLFFQILEPHRFLTIVLTTGMLLNIILQTHYFGFVNLG